MAQRANAPEPGSVNDNRGVAATATADVSMRKTGYRPDAVMNVTNNSLDPNVLVRVASDPRLA